MSSRLPSRRERPAKPALSREWIIEETIRIAQTEGLAKATMRRVAQALDTGAASLYVYFANTAELHAAVTDQLIADLAEPTTGRWDDRIVALLSSYSAVLYAYPGLARSGLTLRPMGPNALEMFERVLALLIEGETPVEQAAWGADLLIAMVTANAAEHADGGGTRAENESQNSIVRAVRTADPERTPLISAHADAILSGPPAARFEWGLRVLIAGIAATSLPTA